MSYVPLLRPDLSVLSFTPVAFVQHLSALSHL